MPPAHNGPELAEQPHEVAVSTATRSWLAGWRLLANSLSTPVGLDVRELGRSFPCWMRS